MRRPLLLLAPLVTTAALFACEDDGSSGGTGTFSPEAGSFEASLPTPNDAEVPRGNDAAVPDAEAPKHVTVRVLSLGQPVPNVLVVFHDTAGAVVGSVKTGADGRASSAGLPQVPTQASALLGTGSNFSIVTWVAVEPGDELLATDTRVANDLREYAVTFPAVPNAFSYYATTGACEQSGGASPITIFVGPECVRASTPILVRADGANANNLGFAFKKGNAPPGDAGALAVTTGAFSAPLTASVDATNLPAEEGNVQVGLVDIAEEVGFSMGGLLSLDGPRNFQVPNGFADARQVLATFRAYQTFGSQQTMVRRDAVQAANVLDFTQRLPKVTAAQVPAPADPQRFDVTWTTEASLAAADGGIVRVRFFGGRDANFSWSFVVPPSAATSGTLKAPAMPADGAGWIPQKADAGATFFSEPEVLFVEASTLPSYAAFRRVSGTLFPAEQYGRRELTAVLPQNGTLRATSFESNNAR